MELRWKMRGVGERRWRGKLREGGRRREGMEVERRVIWEWDRMSRSGMKIVLCIRGGEGTIE